MTPIRVTPPAGPVVPLADLKAHLRVVGNHDDAHITALEAACVAHLDGWLGVLGRCILPQSWRLSYPGAGVWPLPFPDVTAVEAIDGAGDPVDAILGHTRLGAHVEISQPATVTLTAGLPSESLEAVRAAIKVWVQAQYDNTDVPAAFDRLIGPLRRVRL